jgi:hypothetical protein
VIQLLVVLVGGLVTLVPAFLVSPRRRELHFVRDEAAVLKEMQDGKAKRLMEEAHAASAEAYRRRAKGLDKVDKARRQTLMTIPLTYLSLILAVYASYRGEDLAGWLGVSKWTVAVGMFAVGFLVALPTGMSVVRYRAAARARDKQIEAKVEEFEARVAIREAARQLRETGTASTQAEGQRLARDIIAKSGHFQLVRNKNGSWEVRDPKRKDDDDPDAGVPAVVK